jgi:hypothetical protein
MRNSVRVNQIRSYLSSLRLWFLLWLLCTDSDISVVTRKKYRTLFLDVILNFLGDLRVLLIDASLFAVFQEIHITLSWSRVGSILGVCEISILTSTLIFRLRHCFFNNW